MERRWSQRVCAPSWKPRFRGCRLTVWTSSTSMPLTTKTPSRTPWGPAMSSTKRWRHQRHYLLSSNCHVTFDCISFSVIILSFPFFLIPAGKIQGVRPVKLCIMGSGWNCEHLQTQQLDSSHCLPGTVAPFNSTIVSSPISCDILMLCMLCCIHSISSHRSEGGLCHSSSFWHSV